MEIKPKRPASVWIAQILLLLYVLLIVGIIFVTLLSINAPSGFVLIIPVMFLLAFLSLFVAAFIGLAKRKVWGRWLTVGLLSLIVVSAGVNQFLQGTGGSAAARSGYIFGSLSVLFLFGYLIFRLAAGDAASDFFATTEGDNDLAATPPPPPTFDS